MPFAKPAHPGRLTLRLVNLYTGLIAYGLSMALLLDARLGLDPWDVLAQGITRHIPVPIGWAVNGVSVLVLALWIPLRQKPGLGTVSNVIVVGFAVDQFLVWLPVPSPLPLRIAYLVAGILTNALATGLYIGAGFGPGARDGLMTGIAARGHSLRVVRTCIEVTVVAIGWLLGGSVGIGTILYALSIGPLAHHLIPKLTVPPPPTTP
jgi:uncharacterized membrane protein YczE